MTDVDKLIADAKAVMEGDASRVDVLLTRLAESASLAAEDIFEAIRDNPTVRQLHGIRMITGLAWLLGGMAATIDGQSGNSRASTMATLYPMIDGGYDETVELRKST